MKQLLKISAAPAAALFALAYVAMATPAAAGPSEYCRQDVTSGMRSCSFETLEQCQAMSSGRGGTCYRDPLLTDTGPTPINRSARFQNPGYARGSRLKADNAVRSRQARDALDSSLPCADCWAMPGLQALTASLIKVRVHLKQIIT